MSALSRALGGAAVALLLLGACILILSRLSTALDHPRPALPAGVYVTFFGALCVVQIGSLALWRVFAGRHRLSRSRRDAFLDTGLVAVGKYVPGKIWGLLARGAVNTGGITLRKSTVTISLGEQAFSLFAGCLLAVSLGLGTWLGLGIGGWLALAAVTMAAGAWCSLPVMRRSGSNLLEANGGSFTTGFCSLLLIGYGALWITAAVPFVVLIGYGTDMTGDQIVTLVGGFVTSVIAGFAALFAPGGIGVREAAFAALTPDFLTWQEGLYWMTLYRTLSLAFDLLFGLLCLAVYVRRARTPAVT